MQMKLPRILSAAAMIFASGASIAAAQPANVVATQPVYAPDYSHANEPLKAGIIAWSAEQQTVDATNGQDFARFAFSFTNITASAITILNVHPSCGCTTAELPPVPWTIPPGASGQMKLNVNLAAKAGTLFKTVNVSTDKGSKTLMLRINIQPPPAPKPMSQAERAKGVALAMVDRQAVFKGDCASCHRPNVDGKYGKTLFDAICAICHEVTPRASMVPDLHNLPVTTSEEFWRTWITAGKAGTLMPAFATSQSGPLNDMQIASLAAYLNAVNPPHAPTVTNAPAAK